MTTRLRKSSQVEKALNLHIHIPSMLPHDAAYPSKEEANHVTPLQSRHARIEVTIMCHVFISSTRSLENDFESIMKPTCKL
eukprot:5084792-Amphidinium_carterae.1